MRCILIFSLAFSLFATAVPAQSLKLYPHDPVEDGVFGHALSMDGAGLTALAGSPVASFLRGEDELEDFVGTAYIFQNIAGLWTEQAKLLPSEAPLGGAMSRNNGFGVSVAISEDGQYALIGSFMDEEAGLASGAAYVFKRTGNDWVEQTKLVAPDGQAGDHFGNAVAINENGTLALIGAQGADGFAGTAYIVARNGDIWSEPVRLNTSGIERLDAFGHSVAMNSAGTLLVIGSPLQDEAGPNAGAVYIFRKEGEVWVQEKLRPAGLKAQDQFGYAVSVSSDGQYILGGVLLDATAGPDAGAAYVFEQTEAGWLEQAKLTVPNTAHQWFGHAVTLNHNGQFALIGARADNAGGFLSGSAYVFVRDGSQWTQTTQLAANDAARNNRFGYSVAMNKAGTFVLIGARTDETKGFEAGSMYAFGSESLPVTTESAATLRAPFMSVPFPNPTPAQTQFQITLDQPQFIRVVVYDPLGRSIAVLREGVFKAGTTALSWYAEKRPAGLYWIRASSKSWQMSRAVVVVP